MKKTNFCSIFVGCTFKRDSQSFSLCNCYYVLCGIKNGIFEKFLTSLLKISKVNPSLIFKSFCRIKNADFFLKISVY